MQRLHTTSERKVVPGFQVRRRKSVKYQHIDPCNFTQKYFYFVFASSVLNIIASDQEIFQFREEKTLQH